MIKHVIPREIALLRPNAIEAAEKLEVSTRRYLSPLSVPELAALQGVGYALLDISDQLAAHLSRDDSAEPPAKSSPLENKWVIAAIIAFTVYMAVILTISMLAGKP